MKSGHEKTAECLAVFGTGSDVGKSVVTTALCRILSDRGVRVSPFKAQNMSNNSGITPEGLEMGRAQIVQAEASRVAPCVDMNPVLLKPVSQKGAQVVVLGRAAYDVSASRYYAGKNRLFETACRALDRLRSGFDVVIMEGAGSCAEVNLMDRDIVNMKMAAYADAPVIVVADIDRGGVFAQIVGTLACLERRDKDRIAGFIINRFRGDISLFEDGVSWLEAKTGKRVFGVLPWFDHFYIPSEDSVAIERPEPVAMTNEKPWVAVLRLPHISNFTDFDPLYRVSGLNVAFVERVCDLSSCRALILPGSKSTRNDLDWLGKTGWRVAIKRYVENGGHLFGICGGFQMLGQEVADPDGTEGDPGSSPGLNLLGHVTMLKAPKTTTLTRFTWDGTSGSGYEIHMGRTYIPEKSGVRHLLEVVQRNLEACRDHDGFVSENGRVMGTYIHGFFDTPGILKKWLEWLGLESLEVPDESDMEVRGRQYDLLADHVEKYVDVDAILRELER